LLSLIVGFFSDEDLAHGRGVIHTAQEKELKQNAEKILNKKKRIKKKIKPKF
jgi:hypothetical protein